MSVYPNLEERLKLIDDKINDAESEINTELKSIEARMTEIEELCLILRAKVEPYTLNPRGLGIARRLMRDR